MADLAAKLKPLQYDGSYPLGMTKPVIRNWTSHNERIASHRRCSYALGQLPDEQWVKDYRFKVNLAIPQEIQGIEYELLKAISVYELVGT